MSMHRLGLSRILVGVAAVALCSCTTPSWRESADSVPVRGLHMFAPSKQELPAALAFIREVLPPAGVNTLILEFDYSFDFQSRPEFKAPQSPNHDDVRQLARACREHGIELIPQLNCLGHQSWKQHTATLLTQHPEFDETPGKFPGNKGIYCRSYCPLHPQVHQVLFDLIDELARACEAKAFHVGMDEIFILADADCPRCRGKEPADVFAGEVTRLHDHLQSIGCQMWMWGDRFIDGKATGLGKWEGSENGTQRAVELVPKDIVICDWHYDRAPGTLQYFAAKGFDVVACPWRKPAVALTQLDQLRALRAGADREAARHARGFVQTTWCGCAAFMQACKELSPTGAPAKTEAAEAAHCFTVLTQAAAAPR